METLSDKVYSPLQLTTLVILAGGEGRRMGGVNKALLTVQGQSLLAHHLADLGRYFKSVIVVSRDGSLRNAYANQYDFVSLQWVYDTYQQAGPLAGIYAGLQASETEHVLLLPVDTFDFSQKLADFYVALLAFAQRLSESASQQIILPMEVQTQRYQPLFSRLSRAVLPSLNQALSAGQFGVTRWMLAQPHTCFPADAFHPVFCNLNTPEQWQEVATVCDKRKKETDH